MRVILQQFIVCAVCISGVFFTAHAAPQKQIPVMTESSEYLALEDAFEKNNFEDFKAKYEMFRKKYPTSSFLDDAEYMKGMLHAGRKEYGYALQTFNGALRKYPTSNRVRTLILTKGTTLKKMNLPELAKPQLENVKKKFPGSPEALRAEVELKLLAK